MITLRVKHFGEENHGRATWALGRGAQQWPGLAWPRCRAAWAGPPGLGGGARTGAPPCSLSPPCGWQVACRAVLWNRYPVSYFCLLILASIGWFLPAAIITVVVFCWWFSVFIFSSILIGILWGIRSVSPMYFFYSVIYVIVVSWIIIHYYRYHVISENLEVFLNSQ